MTDVFHLIRAISDKLSRGDQQSRVRVADAVVIKQIVYGAEITCQATEELLKSLGLA